jgi:hypothetical protein
MTAMQLGARHVGDCFMIELFCATREIVLPAMLTNVHLACQVCRGYLRRSNICCFGVFRVRLSDVLSEIVVSYSTARIMPAAIAVFRIMGNFHMVITILVPNKVLSAAL